MLQVLDSSRPRHLHNEHVTRNWKSPKITYFYCIMSSITLISMYLAGSHQFFAGTLQTLQLFHQFLTATGDLG